MCSLTAARSDVDSSFMRSIATQPGRLRASALVALTSVLGCAESFELAKRDSTSTAADRVEVEEAVGVSVRPPVRRAPPQFDDADASAIRLFHDVLGPFGSWTDDARLGLVWIPSPSAVGASFVPYGTHGRWTYREVAVSTRQGDVPFRDYVWVSDLPWGWVTFHYGRWAYTGERGWVWIAGRRYAGAWVDWRAPRGGSTGVVGWGPTPPAYVWRISPGPSPTRARVVVGAVDPRDARLVSTPYAAFAIPYAYAKTGDLFARDLGAKLLPAASVLEVAAATEPSVAPSPHELGFRREEIPAPPVMDRGLQQAWMLATPATASAVGAGPELGPPPRLRTWVAGGTRNSVTR